MVLLYRTVLYVHVPYIVYNPTPTPVDGSVLGSNLSVTNLTMVSISAAKWTCIISIFLDHSKVSLACDLTNLNASSLITVIDNKLQ